jgi:UDP:flavonoid glycosyltransferase YjiC (YdhE family)
MRVLVSCSLGGSGHLNPLRPFVDGLQQRGDEVLLVVPPSLNEQAADVGCRIRIGAAPGEEEVAPLREAIATAVPAVAAVASERELFGRLCTAAMLPAMAEAFTEWQPELVLHETCEYAAVVVACRFGVVHAQVAISQGKVETCALNTAAPALEAHLEGVVAQIRSSPYLTRFPASLDPRSYPDTRRYKVPSGGHGEPLPRFWDDKLSQLVYMSFGTVTGHMSTAAEIYRIALDAVSGLPVRVLFTVGNAIEIAGLHPIPNNVHVEAWVPQNDVFREASLVICHGGSGTTFGALAAGLPIVFVPLFADQLPNALRVVEAGAGLEVAPGSQSGKRPRARDFSPARIAEAVTTVLGDTSYAKAAARIAREMGSLASVEEVLYGLGPGGD